MRVYLIWLDFASLFHCIRKVKKKNYLPYSNVFEHVTNFFWPNIVHNEYMKLEIFLKSNFFDFPKYRRYG